MICLDCKKNQKSLTKEERCAECHLKKYKQWAKEFSAPEKRTGR